MTLIWFRIKYFAFILLIDTIWLTKKNKPENERKMSLDSGRSQPPSPGCDWERITTGCLEDVLGSFRSRYFSDGIIRRYWRKHRIFQRQQQVRMCRHVLSLAAGETKRFSVARRQQLESVCFCYPSSKMRSHSLILWKSQSRLPIFDDLRCLQRFFSQTSSVMLLW